MEPWLNALSLFASFMESVLLHVHAPKADQLSKPLPEYMNGQWHYYCSAGMTRSPNSELHTTKSKTVCNI